MLEQILSLHNLYVAPILLWKLEIILQYQSKQLVDVNLAGRLKPEQYQEMDRHNLFNLKPELRSASTIEFIENIPIEITATLNPDLLPELAPHATSPESVAQYLQTLSQQTPDHPLLHTENWFALSVTQQQPSGEIGYTTLWNTLNPAAIAAGTLTETEIAAALTQFFADWTTNNLDTLTETAITQLLNEFNPLLIDLKLPNDSILTPMLQFFTDDDWPFTKIQGEPIIQTAYQGENGEWNCYAKAREDQQQFVFYSICPIVAPEDKRSAIAEFLTRANYSTLIGNFELDYTDGEIRYKTSIDVEGDRLTSALIQRLVYTNVAMMDEYLPAIQAVLSGETPETAIHRIESPEAPPQVATPASPATFNLVPPEVTETQFPNANSHQ